MTADGTCLASREYIRVMSTELFQYLIPAPAETLQRVRDNLRRRSADATFMPELDIVRDGGFAHAPMLPADEALAVAPRAAVVR